MEQRKCQIHPTQRSAAARSTLRSTLSCSLTVKSRTPFSLFVGSTGIPRQPVQRADRPRPRHGLLLRFRRPSANRGPRVTGRHGSATAMVGDHCHLPHDDELPTLPAGIQRVRGSRTSVVLRSNAQSSTLNRPMFSQWRVKETVAQLTWAQLSPVN